MLWGTSSPITPQMLSLLTRFHFLGWLLPSQPGNAAPGRGRLHYRAGHYVGHQRSRGANAHALYFRMPGMRLQVKSTSGVLPHTWSTCICSAFCLPEHKRHLCLPCTHTHTDMTASAAPASSACFSLRLMRQLPTKLYHTGNVWGAAGPHGVRQGHKCVALFRAPLSSASRP